MTAKRAREVQVGDHIVWAGHRCTVVGVHGPRRERHQHKVAMRFDLAIPGLPPAMDLHYYGFELVALWDAPGQWVPFKVDA